MALKVEVIVDAGIDAEEARWADRADLKRCIFPLVVAPPGASFRPDCSS
jgi:hypothetical protein